MDGASAAFRNFYTVLIVSVAIVTVVAVDPVEAERAPFSQAVIDAAMSEPDLRYARGEPAQNFAGMHRA